MYSSKTLGANGKLGNQMFQYAALYAIAQKYNTDFMIPDTALNNGSREKYELLKPFNNLSAIVTSHDDSRLESFISQYREPSFTFDPNFFLLRDECDVFGYFQSELYFKHIREDIKREFTFSDKVLKKCSDKVDALRQQDTNTLCAVHVRRGDYQNHPEFHTNLFNDPQYYNSAMSAILSNDSSVKFVVFSDDIAWCKNVFPKECIFPEMSDHFEDLCLMSKCDYHIIANSSFSWWGAWLSDSKAVIAPKQWFGPKGPPDWSSIYATGWYTL